MDVLMVKSNGEWVGIPAIKGEKGDTGNTGATGQNGADGVSPSVSVSEITGGHKVSVTDASGTSEFNVMDGVDGQDGAQGQDGQNGQDGYSPTVQVTDITGGHQVTITDASGTHVFNVMDGDPTAIINDNAGDGDTAETWSADKEEAVKKALEESKAPVIINNVTGNLIAITDAIVGLPVKNMKVSFSPRQEGTGDPSPTNIRPITGWDGMSINRFGKNIYDGQFPSLSSSVYYRHYFVGNSTVTGSSNVPLSSQGYGNLFLLPGKVNTGVSTGVNDITNGVSRTVNPVDGWVTIAYQYTYDVDPSDYDVQIEVGTTATSFEPYYGATFSISWQTEAGEVYGGTFDALTGVLTVEYGICDMGSLAWEVANGATGIKYFRSSVLTGIKKIANTSIVANIYCSILKTVSAASIYSGVADDNSIGQDDSSNTKIRVKATSYNDDANAFETAMNGIKLVYEFATPLTYQLAPIQIALLTGVNTIWTFADSMEIAYSVDTKKYVDAGAIDVQINGTSIIDNGIADIPVANASDSGVVKVSGGNRGIEMDNGFLQIVYASSGYIKSGSDARKPIVPYTQHEAVFYGLAKLAGVDLASSNTPIGTFTEQAMFAIQKMLGVSQKWELIRHIETTQDLTEVTINTDDYGESFELQRMILNFRCDQSTTGARDNFYCLLTGKTALGVSQQHSAPSLQYTTATSGMAAQIDIETHQIAPITIRTIVASGDGNTQNLQSMAKTASLSSITAFKIYQSASDKSLIPSGAIIDLYGIKA